MAGSRQKSSFLPSFFVVRTLFTLFPRGYDYNINNEVEIFFLVLLLSLSKQFQLSLFSFSLSRMSVRLSVCLSPGDRFLGFLKGWGRRCARLERERLRGRLSVRLPQRSVSSPSLLYESQDGYKFDDRKTFPYQTVQNRTRYCLVVSKGFFTRLKSSYLYFGVFWKIYYGGHILFFSALFPHLLEILHTCVRPSIRPSLHVWPLFFNERKSRLKLWIIDY